MREDTPLQFLEKFRAACLPMGRPTTTFSSKDEIQAKKHKRWYKY